MKKIYDSFEKLLFGEEFLVEGLPQNGLGRTMARLHGIPFGSRLPFRGTCQSIPEKAHHLLRHYILVSKRHYLI